MLIILTVKFKKRNMKMLNLRTAYQAIISPGCTGICCSIGILYDTTVPKMRQLE